MKADHKQLIKTAELGILKSLQSFLGEPLKPGRLRTRFLEIEFIVDNELRKLHKFDPNFFIDNKNEITVYLEKFGKIMNIDALDKKDIHVGSVVAFCLCFLEDTKIKYPEKLYTYLKDILDYYERVNNIKFSDLWIGRKFYDEWDYVNNSIN